MKPARKTRDFSIESILADKRQNSFMQNENKYQLGASKDCKNIRTEEHRDSPAEEINYELSETENRDVYFRSKSDIDAEETCETNSGELLNECRNNSLGVINLEYNRNENKLQIDNKSDRKILKSSEQEKFNSNDTNASRSFKYVQNERAISSKSFESEEIDRSCEEKYENNYCKIFDEELNTERKKQLKRDQRDQFQDNQNKYSNKNCDDLSEDRYKNLRNNFNGDFETIHNKCSLFGNKDKEETEFSRDKPEVIRDIEKLEWLHCTRYRPPKIPRKPTIGKNKRKPSFYPRIPFSMFQLDFLEQKFQSSAYLSRNDVLDISDVLKLPPNRIKIWFQNRRARERRELCTSI